MDVREMSPSELKDKAEEESTFRGYGSEPVIRSNTFSYFHSLIQEIERLRDRNEELERILKEAEDG